MSRVAKIRKENNEVARLMQSFCIDPTIDSYKRIMSNPEVLRDEYFPIWKLSAMFKFGDFIDIPSTPDDIEEQFYKLEKRLCDDALIKPSVAASTKILYIYFATGSLKYIDLFYQCMGMMEIPITSRQRLAHIYKNLKEHYLDQISKLSTKLESPDALNNHFDTIGVQKRHVDFTYFDKYQKMAADKRDRATGGVLQSPESEFDKKPISSKIPIVERVLTDNKDTPQLIDTNVTLVPSTETTNTTPSSVNTTDTVTTDTLDESTQIIIDSRIRRKNESEKGPGKKGLIPPFYDINGNKIKDQDLLQKLEIIADKEERRRELVKKSDGPSMEETAKKSTSEWFPTKIYGIKM